MKARPLRDNILVLQDPVREDVSPAGILIAATKGIIDSQKQFGRKGTVVAVGPDIDQRELAVGDRVLYGEFSHSTYREGGREYVRLRDDDIVGVIEA